jgi:hypothetical protein
MEERADSHASSAVSPWTQVLVGVTPLFLLSLAGVLGTYLPAELWDDSWARFLLLGGAYSSVAVAVAAGWLTGFPGWFHLYPGLLLAGIAWALWGAAIEWGALVGTVLTVLAGVAVLAVLVLLVTTGSLSLLVTGVRRDWTLVSYAVYGLMPFVQSLVFDDAHRNNETVFLMLSSMTMVIGAALYLRCGNKLQRAVTLLGGMTTILLMAAFDGAHFAGGVGPWLGEPSTWRQTVPWLANLWALLAGAMLAPVLLSLLPRPATPRGRGAADARP